MTTLKEVLRLLQIDYKDKNCVETVWINDKEIEVREVTKKFSLRSEVAYIEAQIMYYEWAGYNIQLKEKN